MRKLHYKMQFGRINEDGAHKRDEKIRAISEELGV